MRNQLLKNLPAVLFLAGACTTPVEKLQPEASRVTVLNAVSLADMDRLQRIGTGSCEIGSNARTIASNEAACQNYLRNEAAKKNADYLVFTSKEKKGLTTSSVEATFYKAKEGVR